MAPLRVLAPAHRNKKTATTGGVFFGEAIVRRNRTFLTQVFIVVVPGNQWHGASIVEPFSWNRCREIAKFSGCGAIPRALYWQQIRDENPWLTKLQIAENEWINRSSLHLHINLLKLPDEILDFVCSLEDPGDQSYFTERCLRPLLKLCLEDQLREFERICAIWRGVQGLRQRKKTAKLDSLVSFLREVGVQNLGISISFRRPSISILRLQNIARGEKLATIDSRSERPSSLITPVACFSRWAFYSSISKNLCRFWNR